MLLHPSQPIILAWWHILFFFDFILYFSGFILCIRFPYPSIWLAWTLIHGQKNGQTRPVITRMDREMGGSRSKVRVCINLSSSSSPHF
ncbi:hypothetical protein BO85DRAFT_270777 [Aspergillus piperis CBS 112811]|uniref:Uncharacterized protein n=1 Tax=Aspergillus piperis CBS 112811 TaxID=1448313 RepID=A0A8G1R4D1_9EURO|nr:hypothetical protein BO85DRAFT_270777 [Aspergillus piperis CBS 112811]RAH58272.1 hypothetical protein BO85DRAFT_270777 [Aspergillus piperis CBS 112811]